MDTQRAWYEGFFPGLYARILPKTYDSGQNAAQVRIVRKLLRLRRGQCVLDIPCGQGRLTIPLAEAGMQMTGVDLTETFLRRGRREARRLGLPIRFVRKDMREIDFDAEFDAAFNWFGSFGYFSDEENLAFARRVWRALRPGGRFLVEGVNKSWLKTHFLPEVASRIGGVHVTQRNRWDDAASRARTEWTFERGSRRERHVSEMWIFDGADIRRLLHAAGFRDIRLHARKPFGPLTRHARRIIAVGVRPPS